MSEPRLGKDEVRLARRGVLLHVTIVLSVKGAFNVSFSLKSKGQEFLDPPSGVSPNKVTVDWIPESVDVQRRKRPPCRRVFLPTVDIKGKYRAKYRIGAERRDVAQEACVSLRDLYQSSEVVIQSIRVQVLEDVEAKDEIVLWSQIKGEQVTVMNSISNSGGGSTDPQCADFDTLRNDVVFLQALDHCASCASHFKRPLRLK